MGSITDRTDSGHWRRGPIALMVVLAGTEASERIHPKVLDQESVDNDQR